MMRQRPSKTAQQGGARPAADPQTAAQQRVEAAETKRSKIVTRVVYGALMLAGFVGVVAAGHVYLAMLVILLQGLLFKELVSVRYKVAKEREITTTLFRTLQWAWFAVAMLLSYGDVLREFMLTRYVDSPVTELLVRYLHVAALALYSICFVGTILSLKKGFYKYQLGQLTWTVLTVLLVVVQMKGAVSNIANGLFFFVFPAALVVFNDCAAYVCGMTMGRKLTSRPFLKLSPNKTWEGFGGAFVLTLAFSLPLASFLARFSWMTCPLPAFDFASTPLTCVPDPVFAPSVQVGPLLLAPMQLHAVALAAFASLVAPFGGYFASAVKRAYGLDDFAAYIPGHGGIMDRMDCQLVMVLAMAVYYSAFIVTRAPLEAALQAAVQLDRAQLEELAAAVAQLLDSV